MSSPTEPNASTSPHDTAAPKTTKRQKKSKKSEKSAKSKNKKPSSSSSSSSSSKGRSNPAALTDLQQALARQQQTIHEGTALLAARFRAGLYFWPLDTSLGRVPSGGDRFFVQDAVVPLGVDGSGSGSGGAKTPLLDGARGDDDHGGGGHDDVDRAGAELETGLEMDQGHQQDYVARAQEGTLELARRFQEGLSDEGCGFGGDEEEKDGDDEEEKKEDGEVEKHQQRRRRQQQQWRPGSDRGHRGRLPRLANEARTVAVYRLEDVVGQRQPAWGGHCLCT